jgi:hypothetical protein
MVVEVLVDGCERRREIILAVDASSEQPWLKSALNGLFFLDQPFAVRFDAEPEAEEFAGRVRRLGFRCTVSAGPDPTQRVGNGPT